MILTNNKISKGQKKDKIGFDEYICKEEINKLNSFILDAVKKLPRSKEGNRSSVYERLFSFIIEDEGKKLRPLLIIMVSKILGATEEQMSISYRNAVSLELLHNFSLIHDDILDHAPIRRGKPSYHMLHGIETSISDSDVLFPLALRSSSHFTSLRILLEAIVTVGKGNSKELELRITNDFNFSLEDIIEIMLNKTGTVFQCCLALAGVATEKSNIISIFDDIMNNIGIAYQIQDDFLDFFGSEGELGKKTNWDIQESKRGIFLYFTLQNGNNEEIKRIYSKAIGKKTDEDIKYILKEFAKKQKQVIQIRDKYLESAWEKLEEIQLNSSVELKNLCDFLKDFLIYMSIRKK